VKLTTTLLLPTLNEIDAVRVIIPRFGGSGWTRSSWWTAARPTAPSNSCAAPASRAFTDQPGLWRGTAGGHPLASGDVIIEFNPDGNSIPDDIPRIIAKINEGYDLVIGSRYREGAKSDDDDWLTAAGNWMFTRIVNLLFGTQYTDSLVGFRAYRREQALRLEP
jgi:hypothetical protein